METNNNYFITNMVERLSNNENTLFLNQTELTKIRRILNKQKISYNIYYPFQDAEKVIVYKNNIPPVKVLEIKSKKKLTHSEILGSLFGNNINPTTYGDIIVTDDKYYLIILEQMLNYFLTQFTQIGKSNIVVKEVEMDVISNYKVEYDELRILCSSLRIDNVISNITKLSRSLVDELFLDGNILLNYENVKKFRSLEEGDILSIRRYGKYKFNRIIGNNKKGKLIIEILKYK